MDNPPVEQEQEKVVVLKRKDLDFRWKEQHNVFCVRRLAMFEQPAQVADLLMFDQQDKLERDVKRYGYKSVREHFRHKIKRLDPTSKYNIEQGYIKEHHQALFDSTREEYLKEYSHCYLAHRRNRLQELDSLYQEAVARIHGADPSDFHKNMQTALKIVSEARAEVQDKKIDVEASVDDEGKTTLALRSTIDNLSTDEIKEMVAKHERGESVKLPAQSGSNGSGEPGPESGVRNPDANAPRAGATGKRAAKTATPNAAG